MFLACDSVMTTRENRSKSFVSLDLGRSREVTTFVTTSTLIILSTAKPCDRLCPVESLVTA